jgi:predicted dehydrogenase
VIIGGSIPKYQEEAYFMTFHHTNWILCIGYLESRNKHMCSPLTRAKLYNAPDLTMVQLVFANDIYFNGIWNFNVAETATSDSCEIIGDKGTIRFSFFRVSTIELVTGTGTEIFELEYPVNIQQPHINNVVSFFVAKDLTHAALKKHWLL